MFDLNDVLIFSKVAETNGISSAARQLGMPKSRVSRRMAALEAELDVRLLERNTRSVRLTEAGDLFLQHSQRIIEEAIGALESVNYLTEKPRGNLRVSASVTVGQHLLSHFIAEFRQLYPEIDLELHLTDRRVDLISEGFDVVIRVGDLEDSTLISRRIGSGYAKFYTSPKYLASINIPTRVIDLQKLSLLTRSESGVPVSVLLIGPRNKKIEATLKSDVVTGDLSTLRQMASDGGGIALLPEYLVRTELRQNTLVEVLPNWRTESFNFYALFPSHRGMALKARVWIDFVESKLE